MATIGQVNNRNQRLIAFFKAAILYLCTIPLLIFIIRNNVKNPIPPSNGGTGNESSFQQIKTERDALEDMIFNLDSIATLTEKLIALDKQEFEKKGSAKVEIGKIVSKEDNLHRQILNIQIDEIQNSKSKINHIYSIVAENRGTIDELRGSNVEAKEDKEKEVEQISENNEKETEQTKEAHEKEVSGLEEEIENKDGEIESLNGQLAELNNTLSEKDDIIADFNIKNATILTKVKEIKGFIETERTNPPRGLNGRWKNVTDEVGLKTSNLEVFIESN